ncbi:MAG TPA: hypothetical protein VI790_02005, partial [Candidatus Nanoarchaeia archaeon]|nr:hypothetical protein [Candidatus Nanoarchaeia archaeon]
KDDESLPFPTARVVRLIKTQTKKTLIRSDVKIAMNKLLGDICIEVSKRMAKMPYSYLGLREFKEAAAPYLKIGLSTQEKKRLVAGLKKVREEAATLVAEIEADMSEEDRP